MQKNSFLNYVSHLIDSKDVIYYDDNEQYFYFYHKHFTFRVNSNASSASLLIEEGNSHNSKSESINLSYEECITLLDKMIPLIPTNHDYSTQKITALGEGVFDSYISLLHEFLKNYNPVQDIESYSEKNSLENYVVHFPLDNINHICRIGRIGEIDRKKEYLLTSVVKLPFFFLDDNNPKSACIPYEIIIPSWKIQDYPILQNFAEPKLFGMDFSLSFNKIINNLSHGKELFQEVLQHKLPELHHKMKPAKI